MRRGAFTLIEIVIVVALVVAISAVALPSLASRAAAARIGHAERSLGAAGALAQAEALGRGSAVVLVAQRIGAEWVLWAEDATGASDALRPPAFGDAAPPGDPLRRTELASFGEVELATALPELGPDRGPQGAPGPDGESRGAALAPDGAREPPPERIIIATYFPDGSCRPGSSPLYLVSRDGERLAAHIRPLTGRIEMRRLPSAGDEAASLEGFSAADSLLPTGTGGGP